MGTKVTMTPPATIDEIGSDWTIQLDSVPHSPLISNGTTGEVNFSSKAKYNTHLSMNNASSITFSTPNEDADPGVKIGSSVLSTSSISPITTTISGYVDSVSISGKSASYTQGTQFSQFATTDVDIPWVSSGSALAAFDLAWQLANNKRCNLTDSRGRYWSLRGHDSGFDSSGKIFYPADHSTYKLNPRNDNTYYRSWDLRDAYSCSQWAGAGTNGIGTGADIYAFIGTGTSPTVTPGMRTSIAFSTNNSANGISFNYGSNPGGYSDVANGYSQRWGFGPYVGTFSAGTGKTLSFSVNPTPKTCTTYFTYFDPTTSTQVTNTPTIDLSSLTWSDSTPIKVVTDTAYVGYNYFQWSLYFRDYYGHTVTWTSGLVNTGRDLYAKPWNHTGTMNGLYQITAGLDFNPASLLPSYENTIPFDTTLYASPLNAGLPPLGSLAYDPILPYTGSLWDYLCQVFTAKECDLRIRNDRFYITKQSENQATPRTWQAISDPQIQYDNSNVADTVQIEAQLVNLNKQPIIYNARTDGNQVYSFNAGQTATFTVDSSFIGSVVLNPEPVYAYTDFRDNTPLGGFIVSGADDLPIVAQQWISLGGSVLIRQTGATTLEVTVNCPNVITANGTTDSTSIPSYYFGVSDGQNQYACFTLAGGSGDVIKKQTRTFQTGAGYANGNSSPGAIANPCATTNSMINTLAMQAAAIASGPNMSLNASMSIYSVQNMNLGDIGLLCGQVVYYGNLAWRIISFTLKYGSVDFVAVPCMTYALPAWTSNWSTRNVDEYVANWAGKSHDDMKTMMLSGIMYDYTNNASPKGKFSVYPSAGAGVEKALYPGSQTYPGGNVLADQ